ELAVAVHRGPFSDLDKTYGALGGLVAERAIGVDGPIRENYLVTSYDTADEARHQAEVCWPVFLTPARRSRLTSLRTRSPSTAATRPGSPSSGPPFSASRSAAIPRRSSPRSNAVTPHPA